jgi:glycosyltransferase 2 family protein
VAEISDNTDRRRLRTTTASRRRLLPTIRRGWQLLWRPLGSLAVIGLLLWLVPLGEFRAVLAAIDPLLAAASLGLVLPMAATKAAIFWQAAAVQGLVFSFRQMLAIQLSAAFYTLVVPGQLGGTVARWYKLQKPGRQPVEAAAVMLMARLLETGIACLLGLALAMADPVARSAGVLPILAVVLLAICGGSLLLVSAFGRRIGGALAGRLPHSRWLAPLQRTLPRLRDAASRARRMPAGVIWRIILCSLLWNGLGILSIVLAAMAVGADVSWVTLGWMRSLLAVILLLPLGWGGIGVREAGVVAILQPYGVAPVLALAIGAIISLRHILEAVLGGMVELMALWRTKGAAESPGTANAPLDRAGIAR